jgi:hypothetical protein
MSPATPSGKLVWGMLGAVAPEIIRLNKIITGVSKQARPTLSPPYFLISLANSLMGGIFAVALGGETVGNRLIVGAFWPLALTSAAGQIRR